MSTTNVVQVGAIGVTFNLEFSKDVSEANELTVYLRRYSGPVQSVLTGRGSGTLKTFTGTLVSGETTQIEYVTTSATDLDTPGQWVAQGRAKWVDGTDLPSKVVQFEVAQNIYP